MGISPWSQNTSLFKSATQILLPWVRGPRTWSRKSIDWLTEDEHIEVNGLAPFLTSPTVKARKALVINDAMTCIPMTVNFSCVRPRTRHLIHITAFNLRLSKVSLIFIPVLPLRKLRLQEGKQAAQSGAWGNEDWCPGLMAEASEPLDGAGSERTLPLQHSPGSCQSQACTC